MGEHYKRLFDLTVLCSIYLTLLPIWILVWSLIPVLIFLEDGGPVFYRQKRLGRHGKPFTIVKFRTMTRDADHLGPMVTEVNDRRITRVGKYLRSCHIDESPQVWNILKGEMSIVGPRPMTPCAYENDEQGICEFSQRLAVLPGITGLAQVRGGTWATQRNKLRYDLLYSLNMGPWLDLKMIVMSVPIFLRGGSRPAGGGRATNGENGELALENNTPPGLGSRPPGKSTGEPDRACRLQAGNPK